MYRNNEHFSTLIDAHRVEVEVLPHALQWRLLDEYSKGVAAAEALREAGVTTVASRGLVAQVRTGQRAKERLISSNMRLVVSIARTFLSRSPWLTLDDLTQEGVAGLNRAIEKFDRTKGTAFSTYATWWIRQSIARAVGNSGLIRVPIHAHASGALWADRRMAPLRDFESVDQMLEREHWCDSLGDEVDYPTATDWGHCLVEEEYQFESIEAHEAVRSVLSMLTDRQRDIICRRFGIGCEPETLEEIGRAHV